MLVIAVLILLGLAVLAVEAVAAYIDKEEKV